MDSLVVLLLYPVNAYLEQELDRRFTLLRLWEHSPPDSLFRAHGSTIRAVVGYPGHKVDAALLDALPSLEIFSSFSVGIDHVDLAECRERGVRVTHTPDVLTDDVADLAVGLAVAALRRIPQADRYVRAGAWKAKGDYTLTTRTRSLHPSSMHSFTLEDPQARLSACSLSCFPWSPPTTQRSAAHPPQPHLPPSLPATATAMESLGVLLLHPMNAYLEQELDRRCRLIRLWDAPPGAAARADFLRAHAAAIRAVVGNAGYNADAALIDALPSLEIVASFSVGIDRVDLAKCRDRGIRVTNTPDVLTDDVADLAVGLAIAALRKIPQADRYVRAGLWKAKGDYTLTTRFSGKRVGIIGLGRIGLAVATRVEAFDCPVNYYQRTKKEYPNYTYYPSVVELAANSDVLVVACPLNEQTRHIVNREVIDALGPKGVLINIGRGPHVDEPELVSALVEGRLGGAGLDVFEDEPNVPEALFTLDNVVLVPHVGSGTHETRQAMADLVLGNLEAHVLKKPLLTPVV
ncbi:hypothetical protein QYE76_051481 [Lolium multiflorum]|uniref:Hydroxyphenylpyruvate reductase n=1 Tax=Lolium multiflorum TaxID=4521 RepID=A0AAD8WHY1_LOLMU|nr:hypothetical protein QYE76_051481 [Lolium multiflorum]